MDPQIRGALPDSRRYPPSGKPYQSNWASTVRSLVLHAEATDSTILRILKGNLAPGGAVAKITGKEGLGFTGKARAFDSEDDFVKAVESGSIKKGEKTVVVLRYLGPVGGPGLSLLSLKLS